MIERESTGKREQSLKRWTELHSVMASAAAWAGAERDNLPVSEIKGEKPKALFHWQSAALYMMGTFLSASVWWSVRHELLSPAHLAVKNQCGEGYYWNIIGYQFFGADSSIGNASDTVENTGMRVREYMTLCTDPISRNLFIWNGTWLLPSSVLTDLLLHK